MAERELTAAEQAIEDAKLLADLHASVSYAGNKRPDPKRADPDDDEPEDERD